MHGGALQLVGTEALEIQPSIESPLICNRVKNLQRVILVGVGTSWQFPASSCRQSNSGSDSAMHSGCQTGCRLPSVACIHNLRATWMPIRDIITIAKLTFPAPSVHILLKTRPPGVDLHAELFMGRIALNHTGLLWEVMAQQPVSGVTTAHFAYKLCYMPHHGHVTGESHKKYNNCHNEVSVTDSIVAVRRQTRLLITTRMAKPSGITVCAPLSSAILGIL
eukprot:6085843-Amphidinium_carterae.1